MSAKSDFCDRATTIGVACGCHHCGGALTHHHPGTHHPAAVTALLRCVDCGQVHALRVELHAVNPAPDVDMRSRAYRARKRAEVGAEVGA